MSGRPVRLLHRPIVSRSTPNPKVSQVLWCIISLHFLFQLCWTCMHMLAFVIYVYRIETIKILMFLAFIVTY